MKFVNDSDSAVIVAIGKGGMRVEPRGYIEIPDGYAQPRRADNGSRRPSVIEELAPQLQPADPNEKAEWLKAPPARGSGPRVSQMPTVDGYVAAGIPRAQAEILVRQAHQAAIDALTPKDELKPRKEKHQ